MNGTSESSSIECSVCFVSSGAEMRTRCSSLPITARPNLQRRERFSREMPAAYSQFPPSGGTETRKNRLKAGLRTSESFTALPGRVVGRIVVRSPRSQPPPLGLIGKTDKVAAEKIRVRAIPAKPLPTRTNCATIAQPSLRPARVACARRSHRVPEYEQSSLPAKPQGSSGAGVSGTAGTAASEQRAVHP